MDFYTLSSIIMTIAVLIAYMNHRFIRMQPTIAIMTASLSISLVLVLVQYFTSVPLIDQADEWIQRADFQDLLLKGMLSFLLFAGALTIDFTDLKEQKWEIGTLASISTIASTFLIGFASYYLLPMIGIQLPFLFCMLFGALISPTDPIAVLATFKKIGAPQKLRLCVAGESLFNDGVGIVIFTVLYQLTFQNHPITFSSVSFLFLKQALGGLGFGLLLGIFTFKLLRSIQDAKMIILVTLGVVSGGYSLALWLDISGPLAMVVFGIYLGHQLRQFSPKAVLVALETFWELIDEILNAILFLLIGFEMLTISASNVEVIAMITAIPVVLLIRFVTVAVPIKALSYRHAYPPYTITILTWGGLRGGLALALALSLPAGQEAHLIGALTYCVVSFSIIAQGLTVKPLIRLAAEQGG